MKRLFIIGAMRSGTSSIASYLKQHPDVFESKVKEPNFMVFEEGPKAYYRPNGELLIPNVWASSQDRYEELYAGATPDQVLIDASSSYLSYPQAARSIRKLYPDSYIFVILRDPVERAISAFQFNRARGTESRSDLSIIIKDEIDGMSNDVFSPWKYVHCGKYERNIAPYVSLFPKNRLMLQRFTAFRENPDRTLGLLTEFLGLSTYMYNTNVRVNSSSAPNILSRYSNRILIGATSKCGYIKGVAKILFPGISAVKILAYLESLKIPGNNVKENFDKELELLNDAYSEDKSISELIAEFHEQ